MITLDRLVNVLGGYGVVARLGRVARGTVLRSVVVPEPGVGGDVLLAIGASSVEEAVAWAATAGAPVVVVRAPDTSASDVGDVAVLVINATSWSELAAVVYGLVLEGRETESGRGPTDLFALADSLADAIGGAVVIESARSDVLAYSRGQSGTDPARAMRSSTPRMAGVSSARGLCRWLMPAGSSMKTPGSVASQVLQIACRGQR